MSVAEGRDGLSIGEIARLVGVTTRAIRHYHAAGLVPEPERDSSGYRRYRTADLVSLVRVVRLRALGMPIPQIAARVAGQGQLPLATELGSLVDELDAEIERLEALRDRLVRAIDAQVLDEPEQVLARSLREHGRLRDDADLSETEARAADLVDALHPHGINGAIEDARALLTNPAALDELLQRYRALTDTSAEAEVDALARDAAAALPRPERGPAPVDIEVTDKLLGERLNSAQRRFMRQLRHATENADG
jgi:DNA-binding transcriptional MerR regulator